MIPKSKTLREQQEKSVEKKSALPLPEPVPVYEPNQPIPIKEVKCYNDYVAILQFRIQTATQIDLGDAGYKSEGMVIGFGPGATSISGTRCPSQLKLGEVVAFHGNPVTHMIPADGLYKGRKIVIIPERSILVRLPAVPYEIVEESHE